MSRVSWDSIYTRNVEPIKQYIEDNEARLLEELNELFFEAEWEKYGEGNMLSWELDALGFYHSGHELEGLAESLPVEITPIDELEADKIIDYFMIKGESIPERKIYHLVGTVLDKDIYSNNLCGIVVSIKSLEGCGIMQILAFDI